MATVKDVEDDKPRSERPAEVSEGWSEQGERNGMMNE